MKLNKSNLIFISIKIQSSKIMTVKQTKNILRRTHKLCNFKSIKFKIYNYRDFLKMNGSYLITIKTFFTILPTFFKKIKILVKFLLN